MFTSTTLIFLLVTVWTVSAEIGLHCKQGFTLSGEYCLYVGRGNITYDDANYLCGNMDGSLADSWSHQLDAIKSVLENTASSGVTGAWLYDRADGYKDCTIVDAEKDWQVGALPCDTNGVEMLYVCEGTLFLKDCFGSSCYTLSEDQHYSDPCKNGRGYHARIESIEENQFVAEFLKNADRLEDSLLRSTFYRSFYHTYIDGNDTAKEGEWVFSNGDKMVYFNWGEDEPNNNNNGQDCIVIPTGSYDWYDYECGSTNQYLCEEDNINMSG